MKVVGSHGIYINIIHIICIIYIYISQLRFLFCLCYLQSLNHRKTSETPIRLTCCFWIHLSVDIAAARKESIVIGKNAWKTPSLLINPIYTLYSGYLVFIGYIIIYVYNIYIYIIYLYIPLFKGLQQGGAKS